MIKYETKSWFKFIFKFNKAETLVKLKWLLLIIGAYAAVIVFVEEYVLSLTKDSNINHIGSIHSMLGFVISLLLVFRTNTAYERWWEGRKIWGAMVNNSRNLALKIESMIDNEQSKMHMLLLISNYSFSVKNHLRGVLLRDEFIFDEKFTNNTIQLNHHVPNQIAKLLFQEVSESYNKKMIDGFQLTLLNNELISFTDNCGACERIKNTPIPFSYSIFLKKFIFFYVMTLPLGNVFSMGFLVVPFTMFVFYVLTSIEMIGEEIEDPFGNDANDLPLDSICKTIRKNLHEILEV